MLLLKVAALCNLCLLNADRKLQPFALTDVVPLRPGSAKWQNYCSIWLLYWTNSTIQLYQFLRKNYLRGLSGDGKRREVDWFSIYVAFKEECPNQPWDCFLAADRE